MVERMIQTLDAQGRTASIAPEGLYRWNEIRSLLPIGREAWRLRVIGKKAPAPIRLSGNCTAWRGADVLEWLQNPTAYRCVD